MSTWHTFWLCLAAMTASSWAGWYHVKIATAPASVQMMRQCADGPSALELECLRLISGAFGGKEGADG